MRLVSVRRYHDQRNSAVALRLPRFVSGGMKANDAGPSMPPARYAARSNDPM